MFGFMVGWGVFWFLSWLILFLVGVTNMILDGKAGKKYNKGDMTVSVVSLFGGGFSIAYLIAVIVGGLVS